MKTLEDLEYAFESGLMAWEEEIVKKRAAMMGMKIIREIKRLTPHITGNLKKRWFFEVEIRDGEMVIWVSNDAEYAAPVNYGHRVVRGGKTVGKTNGKHMLEIGIQTYKDTYMQEDVEAMLKDLKEAMKK